MKSKISIPLKNLSKTSFDLAEKSFDSKLSGEWVGALKKQDLFLNTYIQEKFKDILHILPFTHFSIFYDDYTREVYFSLTDYSTGEEVVIGKASIEKYLKKIKNTKKRFTFFNMRTREPDIREQDGFSYHSVSALYDKKTNKVEIFDSIGSNFSHFKKYLKDFFVQSYGADVKIIYLVDRCAVFGKIALKCYDGAYKYKSEGFCGIWTIWFLEIRLANPDIPKEKLIEKALKELKKGDKVCRLLRGYSQFVDKTISKYSLIRTSSNLVIKPKRPAFVKKDYPILYIFLGSLVGSIAAFGILKNLRKKSFF